MHGSSSDEAMQHARGIRVAFGQRVGTVGTSEARGE